MSVIYIGGFPPPYGGVTTKNNNLYAALNTKISIEKVDFNKIKRGSIHELIRFIKVLFEKNNQFVVGVAGKKTRKILCKLLYLVNRKAMTKSIIFLMGGTAAADISADSNFKKYVSVYKCVYAETNSMVETLINSGLENADYYPNCRFKPKTEFSENNNRKGALRCVFFSIIRKEKGVDIILDTARLLSDVKFSFYGPIEENFKDDFLKYLKELPNVSYYGVFNGNKDEVYKELRKYDVLLLPTRYNTEGVPGILVESKISGITCIVSDKSYNSEIIKHDKEGIVLANNTVNDLMSCLKMLKTDHYKLKRLQNENQRSAEHYYIENYIERIVEKMGGN